MTDLILKEPDESVNTITVNGSPMEYYYRGVNPLDKWRQQVADAVRALGGNTRDDGVHEVPFNAAFTKKPTPEQTDIEDLIGEGESQTDGGEEETPF